MKIFSALFRRKHMPPGHIWRGKHRLYEKVTNQHTQALKNEFEIEEKNMFYLRHPFLSSEQSHGHSAALGKREPYPLMFIKRERPYFENVTIESRLSHLRVNEPWE